MWRVPQCPVVTDTTWGRRPAEPQEAGLQVGLDSTSGVPWLFRTSPGFRAHSDVPAHPALPPTHPPPELEVGLPSSPCSEGMEVLQVAESGATVPSRPLPSPRPAFLRNWVQGFPSQYCTPEFSASMPATHLAQLQPLLWTCTGHGQFPWGAPWPRPPRQLLSRVRPRLCQLLAAHPGFTSLSVYTACALQLTPPASLDHWRSRG